MKLYSLVTVLLVTANAKELFMDQYYEELVTKAPAASAPAETKEEKAAAEKLAKEKLEAEAALKKRLDAMTPAELKAYEDSDMTKVEIAAEDAALKKKLAAMTVKDRKAYELKMKTSYMTPEENEAAAVKLIKEQGTKCSK